MAPPPQRDLASDAPVAAAPASKKSASKSKRPKKARKREPAREGGTAAAIPLADALHIGPKQNSSCKETQSAAAHATEAGVNMDATKAEPAPQIIVPPETQAATLQYSETYTQVVGCPKQAVPVDEGFGGAHSTVVGADTAALEATQQPDRGPFPEPCPGPSSMEMQNPSGDATVQD